MAYRKMHYPAELTAEAMDGYLAGGWYRMHQAIFTITHTFRESRLDICPVWWLRFPVGGLENHRSHTRIRRRNQHLQVRLESPFHYSSSYEDLYARYLASVPFAGYTSIQEALYGEGDPALGTIYDTHAWVVSDGDKVVAVGLFDMGRASAASILHFYDPAYASNSLGKYLILLTIDHLQALGCQWYYPGYVVSGDTRFDYKLFLGRNQASYFEPEVQSWQPFREELLEYVESNPEDWDEQMREFLF